MKDSTTTVAIIFVRRHQHVTLEASSCFKSVLWLAAWCKIRPFERVHNRSKRASLGEVMYNFRFPLVFAERPITECSKVKHVMRTLFDSAPRSVKISHRVSHCRPIGYESSALVGLQDESTKIKIMRLRARIYCYVYSPVEQYYVRRAHLRMPELLSIATQCKRIYLEGTVGRLS